MAKYMDSAATVNVIGCIYNNPSLIDNENYNFAEYDFPEDFHRIVFGAIYNLYQTGVKQITIPTVEDYLSQRPKKLAVYKANKGDEYLEQVSAAVELSTFDYYYKRLKKMTLFREYQAIGMDLKWLYDNDNILDPKKKQTQEDFIDNHSLEELADIIDNKISEVRIKCCTDYINQAVSAGQDIFNIIEKYKEIPGYGISMFGKYINTITEGAQLGQMYIRSAATNVGKTRAMIADACTFAFNEMYDVDKHEWIKFNREEEPTLFISTEQDAEQIARMCLAFLSGVDEEHIKHYEYIEGEYERVLHAGELLQHNTLIIEHIPDFSLKDIESSMKSNINKYGVRYLCFDYIHSSMKILSEISSSIKGLREDNVLFLLSAKLRDLADLYQVFILTSTQLNGQYADAEVFDQNLLRGAKAIADKADLGSIMLQVTQKDLESLQPILAQGLEIPQIKIAFYKNRNSGYKDMLLWCRKRTDICRIEPMYATTYGYELMQLDDLQIQTKKPKYDVSAF